MKEGSNNKESEKLYKKILLLVLFIILLIIALLWFFNISVNDIKSSLNHGLNKNLENNKVRLVPSEMEEYSKIEQYIAESCEIMDATGKAYNVSDIKSEVCKKACDKRNMNFSSFDCENDSFACFCIK